MSIIARIPTRFLKTALAASAFAVAIAGCTSDKWGFPYKAPIQQGNWITQEQVALLQPGMTREQVRFALGSPTLTSVLHSDRWDYPYYFKPGYGEPQERKFTVWFDNDRLARWEGDKQPELQPFQLNADGTPQEKIDEEIDAETARQNAQVPIQSTLPADSAQLPALGTPPGGAQPVDGASGVPAPVDAGVGNGAGMGAGTAPNAGMGSGTGNTPDANMGSGTGNTPDASIDSGTGSSTPDAGSSADTGFEAGSGIRAPSMSGADTSSPQAPATESVRQRELQLNAPSTPSPNPATGGAEPLR